MGRVREGGQAQPQDPTRHGSPKSLENRGFQWCLQVFAFLVALMAFGVCVLRLVIDVSSHDGQVAAFRGVSEAFGGHFGGQKPSKTIKPPRFFNGFWKTAFSITRVVQVSFGARFWSLFGALVALLGASCGSFTRHGSLKNHGFQWFLQVFGVLGWVGGVWGVCLAWCRRFFVSWRPSRGFQRRFGGFWRPFRRPKTFKHH